MTRNPIEYKAHLHGETLLLSTAIVLPYVHSIYNMWFKDFHLFHTIAWNGISYHHTVHDVILRFKQFCYLVIKQIMKKIEISVFM